MQKSPENNRDDQKDKDIVEHVDSSRSKQIELDEIYAEILQNIEDRRGAERLHMEEKEKIDDEDNEEKEKT